MHWVQLNTTLLIALMIPLSALLAVAFYYSLRKYSFVKWGVVAMLSLAAVGAIVLLVEGKRESRLRRFLPSPHMAITAHSFDVPHVSDVPPIPSHAEIQAHIDEAMARVQVDEERFENQMKIRIDGEEEAGEEGMALSYVHSHSSSRDYLAHRGNLATSLVIGFVMFAFLYICYLFLDAGTRGQFTWSLRIASLLAFVFLMIAVQVLHQRGSL